MLLDMDAVGPLQIRVLHYLWQHGPSPVLAVHHSLNAENAVRSIKPMAYTTVLTVMRNLVRRKILAQVKDGRAHRFEPLVQRHEYQRSMLRQTRLELFTGNARALLGCLAQDDEIEPALRERLQVLAEEPAPR